MPMTSLHDLVIHLNEVCFDFYFDYIYDDQKMLWCLSAECFPSFMKVTPNDTVRFLKFGRMFCDFWSIKFRVQVFKVVYLSH